MITYIKRSLALYIEESPKLKQWLWFVALWLSGLCSALLLSYPIKLLVKLASSS